MILEEAGGAPDASDSDTAEETTDVQPAARKAAKQNSRQPSAGAADDETDSDETDSDTADDQPSADDSAEDESTEETEDNEDETDETEQSAEEETAPAAAAEDDTPPWARKRFGELSSKIKEKDRQIAELQARVNGTTATQPAQRQAQPVDRELLEVETPEQLTALRQRYEDLEDWAETHRDGIESDPENPAAKSYTREQVAEVRMTARKALRAIPERQAQLTQLREYNARALELFPGFQDPDSEESIVAEQTLRQIPELKRLPNYKVVLGDMIAGEKLRRKAAQAAAAASRGRDGQRMPGKPAAIAAQKVPPAVPGAPARGLNPQTQRTERRAQLRTRAFRTGSEADIASFVESALG